VNGRKLNYFNLNKKITAELVWKSPLELGKNLIELVARDIKGVSVRHQWQIWRESPEEMRADVVSEQNEYLLDKM
jgi:hypothetical protein